ncbi:Oligopeptide ABC transporter, periplasmic oligopeptide-binding protein OppA [Enhygromyxa salina]|uniref:Oligopeptide ABC transporter, periplasmic oligopeptide-binding protein OppA n=1 Tax=Enhygromyxa salina TaxID=215803 RepID=A0A0C2A419_9BACT|nr:ABC transporter substrate-binding protein [Enhygromyxa salina]KIG18138.1 Oligopeptide ABC transporter, periplasmic oligopeptide-binding protein OppA [Enhygromyxa salina]
MCNTPQHASLDLRRRSEFSSLGVMRLGLGCARRGVRRPAEFGLRVALAAALAFTGACGAESGTNESRAGEPGAAGSAGLGRADGAADDPADTALTEAIAIALPQLPRRLDPHDDLEPWAMRIAEDLVFEGLVRRTGDRYPWAAPAIADQCEVDREYAVASITCHVPAGIRFHDGTELTMADVEYSLTYWLDRRRVWIRQRHGLTNFTSVEIVDGPRGSGERDPGRWVRIGLAKRDPLALEALAAIKIVPRELHRGREANFAQHPIGTGPMAITVLGQDRVVAERFADYHDPERRSVAPKIVFRAIADGAHALTALRRGEVHLLPELSPVHVPVELGKPGMSGRFAAWIVSPPQYDLLLWNVASGVQANAPLRGVMHDALPISAIAREVYGAPGLAAAAPIDLHDPTPIDLEALEDIKLGEPVRGGLLVMPSLDDDITALVGAAAGLDALEWPLEQGIRRRPGGSLRLSVTWDARSGRPAAIVARIAAAWESIGVVTPEATAGWNYVLVLLGKGEFKTALLHFGGHSDEDLYELFHSRGAINFSGVADEDLDRALSDYRGAPDRAARDLAKQRISERLAQLRVVSILHAPTHVMLASRRLTGIEFVDDIPRLDRLGLLAGDIEWGT